jgi:alkanesulfonate monooxygenase SsuD/methylene tetrahydromethanopterin reductase-like flavin-dependent oxidoreductase (luciferase family)
MCAEQGRDVNAIRSGAVIFIGCHHDPTVARERALERLNGQYNQDFSAILDRYVAHGDPERVRARMREYIDAGVETFFVGPACPEEFAPDLEQLLADEVFPAFR